MEIILTGVALSVILPVFNSMRYIEETVASILNQSFTDFELIVINDGSTDGVDYFFNSIGDPRLRYFSRENRGLGVTLNELVACSNAPLIARIDADDICLPGRLAMQVAYLRSNPSVGMVGGQIRFLAHGRQLQSRDFPLDHGEIRSQLLDGRFPICHPALMFRRDVFDRVGGYRLAGAGEDLDFFLRVAEVSRIENINDTVLLYRLHDGSLAHTRWNEISRGYAYALHAAADRLACREETSFEMFKSQVWNRRSLSKRFIALCDGYAESFYRKSLSLKGKGKGLFSLVYLGLAALLRPRVAVNRVVNRLIR